MEFELKTYKVFKIKYYLKKNNLFFFKQYFILKTLQVFNSNSMCLINFQAQQDSNLRQNRYEQHVLPLNYRPLTVFIISVFMTLQIKIMRNISIGQIIIILLLGTFLFSDFSKLRKSITIYIVEKYKNFNKKISRKKGT